MVLPSVRWGQRRLLRILVLIDIKQVLSFVLYATREFIVRHSSNWGVK